MDAAHDAPPPPYSETDIYSQPGNIHTPATGPSSSSRTADDAFSSSTEDAQFTPPRTPTTPHSVPAEPRPAVAAYFDSRPAPADIPSERLEHNITVNATTRPEDLALQPAFAARHVTEQDWRTFANFLLPNHAARSNEEVVDRKLRAASDEGRALGDAEVQLGSIRSDDGSESHPAPRREDVERTVEEWNTFFFVPRGILIRLSPEPQARQMPGAWDQSFDNQRSNTNSGAADSSAAREMANQRSWNLGGIRVTEDGIFIGSSIEARQGRLRVGQFTADQAGISYAGKPIAPVRNPAMGAQGYGGNDGAAYPAQAGPSEPRGADTAAARADHYDSSSGSSSESDSESQDGDDINELLDYDELLDGDDTPNAEQYNACSEALQRWLTTPDQHIARADLRALRRQLRALNSQGSALSKPEGKERKKDLKALIKAVKCLAKRQKQQRRQVKRQQRQQRRAGRKERRQQKREVHRARREQRREGRRGHACGTAAPPAPPAPHGVPGVFVPPTPPTPSAPPALHLPPGRGFCGPCPTPPEVAATLSPGLHIPAIPRGRHTFAGRAYHNGRYEGISRAIKKLEERVVERTQALSRLESEMASNTSVRGWSARRMEGRKYALEKEIESLQVSMEGLRMHVDSEYAKSIAEEGSAGGTAQV